MTQAQALDILKSGKNVFLTGEPGAGKTYTINQFTAYLQQRHRRYAITASTGIAATHINGQTIHSWSGLGINRVVDDVLLDKLMFNDFIVRRLAEPEVLVIDEISMLDKTTLDNIDFLLRNLRNRNHPFGGLQIVFVGDFFQLPPVVKGQEVEYAFEAQSWKDADPVVCYLDEQHRQSDPKFMDILTAIRSGQVTMDHKITLLKCEKNPKQDTVLFTHNEDVDELNRVELEKLPGATFRYRAKTSGVPFMVETLTKQCLSPDLLELKKGALVMFTRNSPSQGFVNGSIGRVIGFDPDDINTPVIKMKNGNIVNPPPATWVIEERGVVKASFTQIPLRLAYAMTVHKSQGMSLDSATIDLSKVFEYGQGYVALSRVRSLEGMHLTGLNNEIFKMSPKVIEQDKIFRAQSEAVLCS